MKNYVKTELTELNYQSSKTEISQKKMKFINFFNSRYMHHLLRFHIVLTSCKICNAHELSWKNMVSSKHGLKLGVTGYSVRCMLYLSQLLEFFQHSRFKIRSDEITFEWRDFNIIFIKIENYFAIIKEYTFITFFT